MDITTQTLLSLVFSSIILSKLMATEYQNFFQVTINLMCMQYHTQGRARPTPSLCCT